MKKNYIFGLIFLLFCGLLNAHASTAISENSELTVSLDLATMNLAADTTPIPWHNDFEQCWSATKVNTSRCGYTSSDLPLYLTVSPSGALVSSVIAKQYPDKDPQELNAEQYVFQKPRGGSNYLSLTPRSNYEPQWPAWLFTPIFNLKEGKTYTFSFWYMGNPAPGYSQNQTTILVKGGEVANVGTEPGMPSPGLMNILFDSVTPKEARYKQCIVTYTPDRDIKFSFTLYCKGMSGSLSLDDFEVAELPSGCTEPKEPIAKAGIGKIDLQWGNNLNNSATKYAVDYKRTDIQGAQYQTIYTTNTAFSLTGLAEAKEYTIGVRAICGTDTSFRSPEVPIITYTTPAAFPFSENFENDTNYNKWIFVDRNHAQHWVVGDSAKTDIGRRSLYSISNATSKTRRPNVLSYQGSMNGSGGESIIYTFRDITFPVGDGFRLKLDYRGGMTTSLKGAVYLVDTSFILKEGEVIPNDFLLKEYTTNQAGWTQDIVTIDPVMCSGKTKRLVIAWVMGGAVSWTILPLAIDNIVVEQACPSTITNLAFTGFANGTDIKIKWDAPASAAQFQILYKANTVSKYDTIFTTNKNCTLPTVLGATLYDVWVRNYCSATEQGSWLGVNNIFTPEAAPKTVPFVETFDSLSNSRGSDWQVLNTTAAADGKWFKGIDKTVDTNNTNYSFFISNNNRTRRYQGYSTAEHVYRDITFPVSSNDYLLSFDWTAWGNSVDYLRVSFVDVQEAAVKPAAGVMPTAPAKDILGDYRGRDTLALMANAKFVLSASRYAGKTKRLMFSWINNTGYNSSASNSSAAIDNIRIDTLKCLPPIDIVAKSPSHDSINLAWITNVPTVTLKYRTSDAAQAPNANWKSVTCTNQCRIGNLSSNTLYEFSLQTNSCGVLFDTTFTILTRQVPAELPYTEDFESTDSPLRWTVTIPVPNAERWADRWIHGNRAGATAEVPSDYSMYINCVRPDIVNGSQPYSGIDNNVGSFSYFPLNYYLYREFNVPDNTKEVEISFDWRLPYNFSGYNVRVYLTELDTPLSPFSLPQGYLVGNKAFKNSGTAWKRETLTAPVTLGAKTKRLVFVWEAGTNSWLYGAMAVDSVSIRALNTNTPTDLKATAMQPMSIKVEWESATDSNFVISYRSVNELLWSNDTVEIDASVSPKTRTLLVHAPNTYHEIKVKVYEPGTNAYTPTITVLSTQIVASASNFIVDFEDPEESKNWSFSQEGQKNSWYKGAFGRNRPADTCLYVDMDGGSTNFYHLQKSISHVYRDIEFGLNDYYTLTFDWKGMGNSGRDFLKVSLVDPEYLPLGGVPVPDGTTIDSRYAGFDWTSSTIRLPQSVRGLTKRLVFSWENDGLSPVVQPPTSIDNIMIEEANCFPPLELRLEGLSYYDSVRISWPSNSNGLFEIRHRAIGETGWTISSTSEKTFCIQGLNQNTTYEIQVRTVCLTSGNSAWSSSLNVSTKLKVKSLPFLEDFNNPIVSLVVVNGIQNNRWVIGERANAIEGKTGKSIYVSADGGVNYSYSNTTSITHFYADVTFPTNAPQYALMLDWKNRGVLNINDYMMVYLTDTSTNVAAGVLIADAASKVGKAAYNMLYPNNNPTYIPDTIYFPDSLAGKTKRLVFTWNNGTATWVNDPNPPAAVDNIRFVPLDCITPTKLKAAFPELGKAELSWSASNDTKFKVYYRKQGTTTWDSVMNSPNPTVLQGLNNNTLYEYQVLNTCPAANLNNHKSVVEKFNTLQVPANIPFCEYFTEDTASRRWSFVNGLNNWVIASNDSVKGENRSLFVSYNGKFNGYNTGRYNAVSQPNKYSYAFRDIAFPNNTPEGFTVSFNWVCQGAINLSTIPLYSNRDNLQVFLVDPDFVFDAEKDIHYKYLLSERKFCDTSGNNNPHKDSLYIPASVSGKTKRLVFRWVNAVQMTNSGVNNMLRNGEDKSAMVDNVCVRANDCSTPRLQVAQALLDSVTFKWDASSAAESYNLQYAQTGSTKWESISLSGTSFGVKGLKPTTSYTVRVTPSCDNNMPAEVVYNTPTRLTVFEDFVDTVLWKQAWGWLSTNNTEYTQLFTTNYNGIGWNFGSKPTWFWQALKFAYHTNNTTALSVNVAGPDCNSWIMSPDFYVGENDSIELSFKLAITQKRPSTSTTIPPVYYMVGPDDKFGVFISNDDRWDITDTLAFWSNDTAAHNRNFQKIANSRYGERIVLPIKGLSKGKYKIAFYAESSVANADNVIFIDSLYVQRPGVCEPVSELQTSNTTYHSSIASWKGDYYQKKWEMKWSQQTDPSNGGNLFIGDTNTNLRSGSVRDLLPSKVYNVTARGICKVGDTSAWAQTISFKTASNCSSISNITSIPDSNSAAITWSANGANKVGYQYCYGTAGKTVDELTPTFTTNSSFKAEGLTPVTDYVVYIRPICSFEDTGSWSSHSFRTLKLYCGIPAKPSVASITSTSAKSHCIAAYRSTAFEFRYGSNNILANMHPECTDKTSVEMTGLAPASTYYCAVRAICGTDDTSSYSEISQFTTLACTETKDVNVNWVGDEAIITWKTEGGQNKWEILLIPSEGTSTIKIANDSTYKIKRSDLTPGISYTVKVRTMCGSSYSEYSNPKDVVVGIPNNTLPKGVSINVSPNPATTHAKLSIEGVDGYVRVELFSLRGELITSEMLNCSSQKTKELSLSGLAKGAYTIRITNEKWVETVKLIVN